MPKRTKVEAKCTETWIKEEEIKPLDEMTWSRILVSRKELNLNFVLKCGQSFRWSQLRSDPPEWRGVLQGKLFILSQTEDELLYKVLPPDVSDKANNESLLTDYFQLKVVPSFTEVFFRHEPWVSKKLCVEMNHAPFNPRA